MDELKMGEHEKQLEAGEIIIHILTKPVNRRKFYDYALLEDMLKKIRYFQERKLTFPELNEISKDLHLKIAQPGDLVFNFNSIGDGFYIILKGRVCVQVPTWYVPAHEEGQPVPQQMRKYEEVAQLEMGSSFGELASLTGRRNARIVANEITHFAVLPNDAFEKLLKRKEEKRLHRIVNFLIDTPYFKSCTKRNIYAIQYYFHEKKLTKGQVVCNIGDPAMHLYLIKEGDFEMKKLIPKKSENSKIMMKRRGEEFNVKARNGARSLGRMLKTIGEEGILKEDPEDECGRNKDDMQEISVKKIGKGELFGQEDMLNELEKYTASLKCISYKADVYVISVHNFNKWVRNMPGVEEFLQYEHELHQLRTSKYINLWKKIKTKNTAHTKKYLSKQEKLRISKSVSLYESLFHNEPTTTRNEYYTDLSTKINTFQLPPTKDIRHLDHPSHTFRGLERQIPSSLKVDISHSKLSDISAIHPSLTGRGESKTSFKMNNRSPINYINNELGEDIGLIVNLNPESHNVYANNIVNSRNHPSLAKLRTHTDSCPSTTFSKHLKNIKPLSMMKAPSNTKLTKSNLDRIQAQLKNRIIGTQKEYYYKHIYPLATNRKKELDISATVDRTTESIPLEIAAIGIDQKAQIKSKVRSSNKGKSPLKSLKEDSLSKLLHHCLEMPSLPPIEYKRDINNVSKLSSQDQRTISSIMGEDELENEEYRKLVEIYNQKRVNVNMNVNEHPEDLLISNKGRINCLNIHTKPEPENREIVHHHSSLSQSGRINNTLVDLGEIIMIKTPREKEILGGGFVHASPRVPLRPEKRFKILKLKPEGNQHILPSGQAKTIFSKIATTIQTMDQLKGKYTPPAKNNECYLPVAQFI